MKKYLLCIGKIVYNCGVQNNLEKILVPCVRPALLGAGTRLFPSWAVQIQGIFIFTTLTIYGSAQND